MRVLKAGIATSLCLANLSVASCQVRGVVPPALPQPAQETVDALEHHVRFLAEEIGPRCGATSVTYNNLRRARDYVFGVFSKLQEQTPASALRLQTYTVHERTYDNIEYELGGAGRAGEVVVVGAHYDSDCLESSPFTPGADDNASGVAVLLELAAALSKLDASGRASLHRTVRFVAFTNEEEPYFHTDDMGSLVYARSCKKDGLDVTAMLSLEMLGYYSENQPYPWYIGWLPGLPQEGNFLAVAGNPGSSCLVRTVVDSFSRNSLTPVHGVVAPGVYLMTWSDQWSFWKEGFPAVMITDTAKLRNANYHQQTDAWCTLKYGLMAQSIGGLDAAVRDLAYDPPPPTPTGCGSARAPTATPSTAGGGDV